MTYRIRVAAVCAAFVLLVTLARTADAQISGVINFFDPATGNWNVPTNWSTGLVPNSANEDFAVVGGTSGVVGIATATATIDSAISDTPGGIGLGLAAGNSGTLQISSGGIITAVTTPFNGNGNVYVGVAGTGTLNIDPGGTLNAVALNSGGSTTSLIRLGATTGSGMAVVAVGDANLARTTQVIGPNVDFTANNIYLTGTLAEQITPSGYSTLKANDTAALGGILSVTFDPSITPTVGNSWNLINARQVAGAFSSVNVNAATALPLGQVYSVRTQPGGLGNLVQLAVEQRLVLNVNRDNGTVSISNTGPAGIQLDGFSVASTTLNALNPTNFISLGGTWQTANSTTSHINQLNPTAAPTIASGASQSLGNIFAPAPTSFGAPTDDLTFTYTQPDGSLRTGVVNYTGTTNFNNLVLRVDPTTGAAQLRNTSPFLVNIDNYTIASPSGSLDTEHWNSLDDQNAAGGDWQEANISSNRLSELKFAGSTPFSNGQFFNIGAPFNASTGLHDLTFQFLLHGETTTRTGVVVYAPISTVLAGDYNNNGVVDAGDYAVWRKFAGTAQVLPNDPIGGTIGAGQFNQWRANFGSTGGAGSSLGVQSVPEPSSWLIVACGFVVAFMATSLRRSPQFVYATHRS